MYTFCPCKRKYKWTGWECYGDPETFIHTQHAFNTGKSYGSGKGFHQNTVTQLTKVLAGEAGVGYVRICGFFFHLCLGCVVACFRFVHQIIWARNVVVGECKRSSLLQYFYFFPIAKLLVPATILCNKLEKYTWTSDAQAVLDCSVLKYFNYLHQWLHFKPIHPVSEFGSEVWNILSDNDQCQAYLGDRCAYVLSV